MACWVALDLDSFRVLRFSLGGLVYYQFDYLASQSQLIHGVFTRQGGASPSPWASLNLSRSTGDSSENVAENNARMLAVLGLARQQTVSAWLNHGASVAVVNAHHTGTALHDVDALITNEPGVFLSMRFADCAPVVLYDKKQGAVGLVHAGWPGVRANIVLTALKEMQRAFGSQPGDVWVGIGPAIRACCYQFGAELAAKIAMACPPETQLVIPQADGTVHLDLVAAIISQARAAGVLHVEDAGICTACRVDEWFSHRVEKKTGRFGVVVGQRMG